MDRMAAYVDAQVEAMFRMAQAQYGPLIAGHWMYDGSGCPACGGAVDEVRMGGKVGISMNYYFYRPRGVLIVYFLCGRCAETIHRSAKRIWGRKLALHAAIERNLEEAYHAQGERAGCSGGGSPADGAAGRP